ncbi:hypothetical protein V1638_00850 [Pseudarthrobacter sp. J64]|uniref:helix-turn-helix transcriptional regulator n=1 Tax=Pseudarthrobacter sp. J64 TaxID=3116485 RepID=UPI002E8100FA|nr:hypothetical protein [Pseudarthrobacter sp. J64]MEE2567949.1 hypothetical protein [Pseudarthrobacter sp. J64]
MQPESGLNLTTVEDRVHGAHIVLVSRRRMWTDVLQRCLTNCPDAAKPPVPAQPRHLFIVDAAMDLQPVVEELLPLEGKILVYGGILHSNRVIELLRNGADGYLPELAHRAELVEAINALLNDDVVAPFQVPHATSAPRAALTPAEEKAAKSYFLAEEPGSRAQAADSLGISVKTLNNQLLSVRRKVGAKPGESRTAVARRITGAGLH